MITETIILLKSTGNYIYSRIEEALAREAYRKAMTRCIELVSVDDSNSLNISEQSIEEYSLSSNLLYPKKLLRSNKESIAHELACEHALDIIRSLRKRFITGDSANYYIRPGVFTYENKSIF